MGMPRPPADASIAQRRMWYRMVYLRSEWWKQRRLLALMNAGKSCEVCFAQRGLEVHHITYKNLEAEKDEDLMVLCQECHDAAHAIGTKRPKNVTTKMMRRAIICLIRKKPCPFPELEKKFSRAIERLKEKKEKRKRK